MPKITPFLSFDGRLDEALAFYMSIFKDAEITMRRPGPDGKTFAASLDIAGQRLMAMNGGPSFKFSDAASLFISCKDQAEVDYYWEKLVEGGTPLQCGWLRDPFGLTWQVIPEALMRYFDDTDAAKAGRVQAAMMKMVKIDISALDTAARAA
jgi:predicted 3-demethylubiquinone-9 3-methyltransferase (glyoxalase superfamily)